MVRVVRTPDIYYKMFTVLPTQHVGKLGTFTVDDIPDKARRKTRKKNKKEEIEADAEPAPSVISVAGKGKDLL